MISFSNKDSDMTCAWVFFFLCDFILYLAALLILKIEGLLHRSSLDALISAFVFN